MKEFRAYPFEVKAIGEDGLVEGYASVFSVVDYDNDVIEPGAFTKTLQERKSIPVLWQHNPQEPIGVTVQAREDARGLHVVGQLNLETQRGREAFSLLKQGALQGLSIGFDVVKQIWEGSVRRIKEVRLWEWSLVTFPANPLATVTAVKGVVPYQDLPLADRDRAWDADAARARVARWAGGPDKDKIDWGKYRKAFLWYDDENPENYGSYKLPIADVIDGKLYAIPRGIFAAAAAIQGARGGVNIPEGDIPAIKRHLERYYARLDMTPPWKQEEALSVALLDVKSIAREILEQKYGRTISAANRAKIEQVIEILQSLIAEEPQDSTPEGNEPLEKALDEALRNLKFLCEVI